MLQKNWPNFSKNLISKVAIVLSSGKINYTNGPYGKKFEKNFSKFIKNKYSVAICNGTAALEVAIKSLKLPEKSEIIVPARSFFSSAACIVNTGHVPIFADVDLLTQNISVEDIKKKITKKTKAIICVHLAGLPCEM
jgi:dTDP-4-amino-4,6-dideoxygalactose transaminase